MSDADYPMPPIHLLPAGRRINGGIEEYLRGSGIARRILHDILNKVDYPRPPAHLLSTCQRPDGGVDEYLRGSWIAYKCLRDTLDKLGRDFYSFNNILDFGCGCSRVLRCLIDHPERCNIYGTDIREDQIEWNRNHIPFINFSVNSRLPPLVFPNNQFDLIYSISVISHFGDEMLNLWLRELKRVMVRDGILIFTICGQKAFRDYQTWSKIEIDDETRQKFKGRGYVCLKGREAGINMDLVFHHKNFILPILAETFTLVEYFEGAYLDVQDVLVCRNSAPI